MGRRRTKNLALPPHMARQGRNYYYVCNKPRRWISLGSDKAVALREWARLEAGPGSPPITVAELAQRYIDLRASDKVQPLSANSVRQYRSCANTLAEAFPIPAAELTAQHVAIWRNLNRHRPSTINGCIALLSASYALGREEGHVTHDPAVKRNVIPGRERKLTDAEFRAIREHAVEWLQVALDLGYLLAARPVDIRGLRWEQVSAEAVSLRQVKTKVRQAFTMTPELAEVLAKARSRRVLGLYVVADAKGRPISKARLEQAMRAACEAADVQDATFRDLRAMSATDADAQGQDAQALLGHTSPRMTERYVRGRRTLKVDPLRRKV